MRLSILRQFVLSMLGLTLVVLLATLLLARWSFERGFAEYVNALERNRLAEIAQQLVDYYDSERGWAGMSRYDFERALQVIPERRSRRDGGRSGRGERSSRPGPGRGPSSDSGPGAGPRPGPGPGPGAGPGPGPGPGPGAGAGPGSDRGPEARPRQGPTRGDSRLPPPSPDQVRLIPTAVFDADGVLLYSHRYTQAGGGEELVHPLRVNGERIGELRSLPMSRLALADESAFLKRQGFVSVVIFVAATALSLIVSLLLSRRLVAPLRRAHSSLGELVAGNYGDQLNSARADEIGDLMRNIDSLSNTLEQNQGARRRWIADISHELRTPIAVLKGELEAIADGIRPFGPEQLQSLQAEVSRLAKLVDDLYQLSLADLGGLRYEFRSVDIIEFAEGVAEDHRERLAQAGLPIDLQLDKDASPLWVRADPQRLTQLLRNLFENSLAYTDAPGEIILRVGVDAGYAKIEIEDSAPSVPVALCEQLFDPLYRQESSRSRRSAGAGLGLAICRAVVEAHDGEIKATPSDQGGLKVAIRLPVERS